jgi:alpha-1,6-mannosyltransferase
MTRLSLFGCGLVGLVLAGVSLHIPGALGIGSIDRKTWFVVFGAASLALYLLSAHLVVRHAMPRKAIWIVLAVAAAMRLPPLLAPPFLSTDVYRYVWDGKVQAAGINPYRYVPADAALAKLRDTQVYPRINRAAYAPTIYPPAAEAIFAAVGWIWQSVAAVKISMVGFECVAIICALRLLALAGLPPSRVLIYAWNPLPVWNFAGNGHVDAAAIAFVALALLLHAKRSDLASGVAIGLAIAVKFLPAVVAPVLWKPRRGWRTATAAIITILLLYTAYVSVGLRVFGFLGGYGQEEGYDTGSGFWLLAGLSQITTLPSISVALYKVCALAILFGMAAWFAFLRPPDNVRALCMAAALMIAALTTLMSPHYPWYFAWLSLPAVVASVPALVWLSSAPILMYLDTAGDRFFWPSAVYGPAIILALLQARRPSLAHDTKEMT